MSTCGVTSRRFRKGGGGTEEERGKGSEEGRKEKVKEGQEGRRVGSKHWISQRHRKLRSDLKHNYLFASFLCLNEQHILTGVREQALYLI